MMSEDNGIFSLSGSPRPGSRYFILGWKLERSLGCRVVEGYIVAFRTGLNRILVDLFELIVEVGAKEVLARIVGLLTLCDGIEASLNLCRKCRNLVDSDAAGIVDGVQYCAVAGSLEGLGGTGSAERAAGLVVFDVDDFDVRTGRWARSLRCG